MKKISRSRKRRIYASRIASLVLAATIAISGSPLNWALAATSKQGTDTEAVDAEFTAERNESTATETVEIQAFESRENVIVRGITLPDGEYVEGDTAEFVVKENGDYDFTVVYDEVIEKEDSDSDDSDSPSIDPPLTDDPVVPVEPGDSGDPGDSEGEPGKPGKPIDPDAPVEPGKPIDPDAPAEPGEPIDPDAPVDPEIPGEPGKPVDPNEPIEPENPEAPDAAEKPEKPEAPDAAEKPEKPEAPDAPEKPEKEEAPAAPEEKLSEAKRTEGFIPLANAVEVEDAEDVAVVEKENTLFMNHSRVFTYTVTDLGEPVELLTLGEHTRLEITDPVFRKWIWAKVLYKRPDPTGTAKEEYYIYNSDLGKIKAVEEVLICYRDFSDDAIDDLTGIEYFESMTKLECNMIGLNKLDVSKNPNLTYLNCSRNRLLELDVSNNPELTYLDCGENQLAQLDVSKNSKLTFLNCNSNLLKELDVSNNPELTELNCSMGPLRELDVSKNLALSKLNCSMNPIEKIDVSNNSELTILSCRENGLSKLDVRKNPELTFLDCSYNELSELDVSNNPELTFLHCKYNELSKLDVSNNLALTRLSCTSNQVSELDISKNPELTEISCSNNKLSELDLSNNPALIDLYCSNNKISELDVSNKPELTFLYCDLNQLTSLNLINNTKLRFAIMGDQKSSAKYLANDSGYTLDISQFNDVDIEKVYEVKGNNGLDLEYDSDTGKIQFPSKPGELSSVSYKYSTGASDDLPVELKLLEAHTVIFDAKEGTGTTAEVTVINGRAVEKPNDPTPPEGMKFKLWAATPAGEIAYDFATPVTTDFTLYAIYEQTGGGVIDPTPTPDPDPEPNPDPTPDPTPDPGNPGTGSRPDGGGSKPDRNPTPNPKPTPEPAPVLEITPAPIPDAAVDVELPIILPVPLPVVQPPVTAVFNEAAPTVELPAPEEVEAAKALVNVAVNPLGVSINGVDNVTGQAAGATDRDLQKPEFGAEGSRSCILHWMLLLLIALTGSYGIIQYKKNKQIEIEYEQRMKEKR